MNRSLRRRLYIFDNELSQDIGETLQMITNCLVTKK